MDYFPDDFRIRYPEFEDTTTYPDERVELFIADAQDDIGTDETHWGGVTRYTRAIGLLTAHYLVTGTATASGDTSPLQAIESRKVGDVTIKHTVGAKTTPKSAYEDRLKSTAYGQEFLALRRRSFVGVIVTPDYAGVAG